MPRLASEDEAVGDEEGGLTLPTAKGGNAPTRSADSPNDEAGVSEPVLSSGPGSAAVAPASFARMVSAASDSTSISACSGTCSDEMAPLSTKPAKPKCSPCSNNASSLSSRAMVA